MLEDILFNSKQHNSKLEKLNIVNINKDPRRADYNFQTFNKCPLRPAPKTRYFIARSSNI